ncbi:1,4-alpha-glucan branching protein GlgB [Magnetospirillum gryphiswaldense]|uniref:1,4-alpha-glucan branching enzyme GlgB n=1 Tax=Magnetospirillum gryphiswaldense TaxID=55518 RepID=A4TYY1_9PROT|nr:1,4-alpha-glucan branching protein GlgB [Magnetospirillum gryphiswaldense]AVM74187.1 1,4-alpha-glucan branching enzyme GlgB [Magnetospirillum gryphiswaldense MSR-1]AVM78090.1 1,4-alpha-glucan branching enzyme GlgB [Magnetospirillum gryphiswaldense]CAM75838.1 1,4-alpha-glucan branching enzyme [Magnetospirillum gryphiswaldense MSR-1]
MTKKHPLTLDQAEIGAIAAGTHGNPFAILGPHHGPDGWSLRVFAPEAARVWAIGPAGEVELPRLHAEGFFCAPLSDALAASYRLRQEVGGRMMEREDTYRFPSLLGDLDIHLLVEGRHLRTFEKLGAHLQVVDGIAGVHFAVWAPNAKRASVVGDFNGWDGRRHVMRLRHDAGVWELFIPGLGNGTHYKYELIGPHGTLLPLKADPYGHYAEVPPRTASVVADLDERDWADGAWMKAQAKRNDRHAPISIYEVHLGSWMRVPEDGNRMLTYGELADKLTAYVQDMGFTHVEFLPVHEHPFSGSWGYQPVGLFAPTSRHGTPEDFRLLVERLHQAGIGVIIDWVAGHFPRDAHGLHHFDGTHLYEHEDPRLGLHKDWDTHIYNYGRTEVCNFLYSNALYWMEQYHVDGLRVDAVASMLYLDYSRNHGEWLPNRHGGNENLEAIDFLRQMNEVVYAEHPGAMTIAEESTAWPGVSKPTWTGGLGFGFKWNMGWMHDTLDYFSKDPIHRRFHHDSLTFGLLYAFTENFVLPLSHDEVVHGKGSILGRMPGDDWQRFANLRAYYAFMWTHPGKKLLFMGQEFGQQREWNCEASLDWDSLQNGLHLGAQRLVRDLNRLYRVEPALHQLDHDPAGFQWVDCNDRDNSVLSFLRRGFDGDDFCLVVCNLTPVVRYDYRIGVPLGGRYREVLNTDSHWYGGSDINNGDGAWAEDEPWHDQPLSVAVTLPPLSTLVFKRA